MSRSSIALTAYPLTHAVRGALGLAASGALVVTPLLATAQEEAEPMDTVVVVGTALKVDTPALETPRSMSLIDEEELENRAVTKFDEALRYRSGVLSAPFGRDTKADWFYLRGFNGEDSTYQDGLRLFREGGYFWWQTEPFGLERIDVLKGPASILYGEAPPGGVVNATSKRPTEEAQGQLELQGGNKGHRQLGIDSSGPVGERDDVRYRMVGLFREGDGELDGTDNQRVYLAPSLSLDLSDATKITFLGSYMRDHGTPTNGFFLPYGTVEDTPFGRVPRDTNLGEPDYDRRELTQLSLGYELEHEVSDTWEFQQNLRYSELDLLLRGVYASYMNDGRTAGRGLTYRDGSYDAFTVDNRLVGNWYTESTENTLLLGVDYQKLDVDYRSGENSAVIGPIDLFNPQYGNYTPASLDTQHNEGKEQIGLYAQNQLRLYDRWILLAGLRHDSVDVTNRAEGRPDQGFDDSQLSLTGGIMYLGDHGISPYLSYSESFSPQVGSDPDGNAYVPSEGEQWELGVKFAPNWLDGYLNAALFDLKESNTLYTSGQASNRQGGERHSRGFELEGVGFLTEQLQLTAAYTYTDTRVDISPEATNLRAGLIPRHQASLWLDYGFDAGILAGLSVGGGVRYVGDSVDSPQYSDTQVPSYTVYDAKVSYDINESWTAQLNVNNLTDEEYVSGCEYWCYYGESRSVIGSLSYRW
ncbi:TonB-dependent siderophore receptor [Billgrantia pellis]|uniref:TonB-dependent siderophore receptor n=1 Tax=Billgrantia pellis TaxID=2606936 RepID=A0A7V7FYG5_9GAMM|nr:TonB-dependent siderophore receptor [Halomonas pellis]KAA0011428.1 TonB-dependent siderophore receptor [Halomonas pellis]